MKRKLFLALIACVCTIQFANAQKLHKIIFCATDDRGIGESVKVDNDRSNDEIDAIAGYIGYEVVDYVYNGGKCTKQNLLTVLNGLNCSSQDIVFFYYSGHGVHPDGAKEDKFPQMCLNTNIESMFVPARQVEEIIRSKGPRLRFIITDCCNNINSAVSIKSAISYSKGVTIAKGNVADNYRRLFVNSRGKVMTTGSKLGQVSWCAKYPDGSEAGGLYSAIFWEVLQKCCEEDSSPTWAKVVNTTKTLVGEYSRKNNPEEQNPDDALEVTGDGGAVSNPGSVPPPPTPSPTPTNATTSSLSQALAQLLSMQNVDSRLAYRNSILQNCFRGNGTVVTVGRNLTTVVDYETASDFLRRIAINKNILRINVIKEETDVNGNPYVTVHEMRKE